MELEICPQRAAKKPDAIEYDLGVVQHVDILWRLADEIVDKPDVKPTPMSPARMTMSASTSGGVKSANSV